jgi:hypothetical protein
MMERRVRSMVTDVLRPLYATLVRLHPPAFRQRFAPEMLSIFDHAPVESRAALAIDAAVSLLRQWLFRPQFHQPDPPAPQAVATASMFAVLDDDPRLTASQWIGGAVLSLLAWIAASFLIGHATFHFVALNASETSTSEERRHLAAYFDEIRVLNALDLNRDLIISPSEIANAPWALRSLDKNHDGALSARECGINSPGPFTDAGFMRFHPVLAALDANHDGVISTAEIANAPAALDRLDQDRDGRLTAGELLPHSGAGVRPTVRFDPNPRNR